MATPRPQCRPPRRGLWAAGVGALGIGLATYGVFASTLNVSGSAGTAIAGGTDPTPVVTSSCQEGELQVAAQYSDSDLDPDAGFTQPKVNRYFLTGVDHDACKGRNISVAVLIDNRSDPHCQASRLTNGGFEIGQVTNTQGEPYSIGAGGSTQVPLGANGLGWTNTGGDAFIEFLGAQGTYAAWPAAEGATYAELNGSTAGTFHQDVHTEPGDVMLWSFKHRAYGANPTNSLELLIGDADHQNGGHLMTSVGTYTTAATEGWVAYSGSYTVPNGQKNTRFQIQSLTGAPEANLGNHIDGASFTPDYCLSPVYQELPTKQNVQASLHSYTWNENRVIPRGSSAQVLGFSIRID